MAKLIRNDLRCSIALSKAALLSSSNLLLSGLRARIGALAGLETVSTPNLRMYVSSGRNKRQGGSVRLRRYNNGSKRRPLIAKLRRAVGPAIASIVFGCRLLRPLRRLTLLLGDR